MMTSLLHRGLEAWRTIPGEKHIPEKAQCRWTHLRHTSQVIEPRNLSFSKTRHSLPCKGRSRERTEISLLEFSWVMIRKACQVENSPHTNGSSFVSRLLGISISYLFLPNKLLPTYLLNRAWKRNCLTANVDLFCFKVSLQSSCWPGLRSHWKPELGKDLLWNSLMWLFERRGSLVAAELKALVPCHVDLPSMVASFIKASKVENLLRRLKSESFVI